MSLFLFFAREQCGRTPLHLSVAYGDIAMAQSLIAAGALIDIKDTVRDKTRVSLNGLWNVHDKRKIVKPTY